MFKIQHRPVQTFTHRPWCTRHLLEEEIDGTANDVCTARVTVGDTTVGIEDSPSWTPAERDQIVPPSPGIEPFTATDARNLAAALTEAARLVEEGSK